MSIHVAVVGIRHEGVGNDVLKHIEYLGVLDPVKGWPVHLMGG